MTGESIGGRSIGAALDALPRDRWRVLHDVPWPGRAPVTIDHVVVGRAGVFVIDTKSWAGPVSVRDGVLRQGRFARHGAVSQAAEAARAVGGTLRHAMCPVQPVLCLDRDEPLAVECDGVQVCTTATVVDVLEVRPEVLVDIQVQRVAHDLAGHQLPRTAGTVARSHRSSSRGVAYLVGALAALAVALLVVIRPDFATDAVRDLAEWVADQG